MTTDHDPAVYSDTSIGDRILTWREVAEQHREELRRLSAFHRLVLDLDRNANGRHEGDADVGDPSGASQGNPLLPVGTVIGWDIRGHPYVVPPRGQRHDPTAWGARA